MAYTSQNEIIRKPWNLVDFIDLTWFQVVSPYFYYVMHLVPLIFLK